jgi:hypothetical protein
MCVLVPVLNESMRTMRLFSTVSTIIAVGFLLLATTYNAAFAQTTSAISTCSISQSNTQTGIIQQCNSCTSNTGSCNQLNINFNNGHAAQATSSSDTIATITSNADSSSSQTNTAFASSNTNVKNYAKTTDHHINVNSVTKIVHRIK